MYYVTIEQLNEGMILGRTIYSFTGLPLLCKGTILNKTNIDRLRQLKYSGVYVCTVTLPKSEEITGLEELDLVPPDVRFKLGTLVCQMFMSNNIKQAEKILKEIDKVLIGVIEDIIQPRADTILYNPDLVRNTDTYLFEHSVNVSLLSMIMGFKKAKSKEIVLKLGITGLLHDIGKRMANRNIYNKTDSLTDEEWAEVKKHPVLGYEYARKLGLPYIVCRGILEHHERYDKSGYPYGKKGKEIGLFGQIIAVADVYDALIANKIYRSAIPPSEVYKYVLANREILFSPDAVRLFTQSVPPYPVGTLVQLSNGDEAVVIKNHHDSLLQPTVQILKNGEIVTLNNNKNELKVVKLLN